MFPWYTLGRAKAYMVETGDSPMMRGVLLLLLVPALTQADIRVTTWNIEHLGSDGRGFGGGFGAGNLPRRSEAQLRQIGEFIRDTLQSDVIAVQEIAKTGPDHTSLELDTITAHMGSNWEYFLADHPAESDMANGFVWNTDTVNVLKAFTMHLPNVALAGKELFDRRPIGVYLELKEEGETDLNDIVLINVHLASGQDFDENHAIAMIAIEHAMNGVLRENEIAESDRVILGDFNDNPHALSAAGNPVHIRTLYDHTFRKTYVDLVPESLGFTRMDSNLRSLIDHVLANASARNDIIGAEVERFTPGPSSGFAEWRETFSDHFPLSFLIESKTDFDVDFGN